MQETNLITQILLGLVVLHFVVGFGFLIYKLSPRKKESEEKTNEDSNTQK